MILRARTLLPLDRPAIEDGAVVIQGGGVSAVGKWPEVRAHFTGEVLDLGESVVLPGLVNAHAHLDYTRMAGRLRPPREFTDWIQGILALKSECGYSEYAESWIEGARMLCQHGTTTVVDIEAVPELLPQAWSTTPLRVISCLELTGVRSGRDPADILREAIGHLDKLPVGRCESGLSPHAPYSTGAELLRLSAAASIHRRCVLTTHVAESEAEFAMFSHAKGPMYRWLARNGRNMGDCGEGSPVRYLARLGYLTARLLAVHVNYLGPEDARILGEHGTSVVHCPRSHAYFGHAPFPFEELRAAGVNVALGTDSLASVRWAAEWEGSSNPVDHARVRSGTRRSAPLPDPGEPPGSVNLHGGDERLPEGRSVPDRRTGRGDHAGAARRDAEPCRIGRVQGKPLLELDLFAEMRAFRAVHPEIDPRWVLGMTTRNGAAALGWETRAGRLGTGSWGDLAVLRMAPGVGEVYEAVIEHRGPVAGLMIAGDWVIESGAPVASSMPVGTT